ncbi:MAG TPA: hypothetical protein VF690_06545 [Hymenobacter sp.]
MPIQCAAPQIKNNQEAELTGSTYLNGRYEVAATYSPVRHLLVRAAYSSLPTGGGDTANYYRGRQYELAAGTYWPLGANFLVGGLGGFGQVRSQAKYKNDGGIIFFGSPVRHVFDAHYNKLFGEVYGSFQASETISFGAAYRVTQVHFTSLTDVGVPVALRNMTRSEPMLFFRTRIGRGPADSRPFQLQMTWGTSDTFGYRLGDNSASGSLNQLQKSRNYLTIGATLFPHCLIRQLRNNKTDD